MAELKLYGMDGKSMGEVKASDKVFSIVPKQHVVNTVLTWYLARARSGNASAKNRSEVSGGGKKPWKQKGTGRARAGDNRSPLWKKGGVVFPPKPRDYAKSLPDKLKKLSLKMVLSDKVKDGKLKVVESIDIPQPKTKEFAKLCKKLKIKESALFVDEKQNKNAFLASRNIPNVKFLTMNTINVYDLLRHEEVVLTKAAVSGLEGILK